MNLKDYEIMAPVGSRESLAAALQAGAGSVYFGVEQLNMRSHSANHFTIDDLRDIAAQCKAKDVKSYLTVNTIIYGEDIELMHQIVDAAKEADITAIIASDVAVMQYCRQVGVEVHLSTQLNISNIEALKFYAQFADVVVLARELNLDQVADIYRQIEEQHLPLPPERSYEPVTLEDQVVCYADKFYSKTRLDSERTVAETAQSLEKFGEEGVRRFLGWAEIFE